MRLFRNQRVDGAPANADVGRPRFGETKTLLQIAAPLIAAYAAEFAMVATTKAIVGGLGYVELAAVGLAGDLTSQIILVSASLFSVVGVLVAQAEGAGRKRDAGVAARQGLMLATLLGLPIMVLVWNLDSLLALTGQDPQVIELMRPFLAPLGFAVLPLLWFFVLRMFVAALARTRGVMAITLAAVGLNYVLCRGLVEGAYGLPELGVAGAGWAKTLVAVFMCVSLVVYAYATPIFRGYGLFRGRLTFDAPVCGEILKLGLPVVAIVLLESGLFSAVSIFSGALGPVELATYQVMMAWISIAFVAAHGLAEAGMVRVAHHAGGFRVDGARRAGLITFGVGVAIGLALVAPPLLYPQAIVEIFLEPSDPGFEEVLALTSRLLILAAFFQIFDGLQVMASFALRGLRDVVAPLWLAAVGYWGFGVFGGWWLAFPGGLGADGLWWGMAAGLTVTGCLLTWRFVRLTRAQGEAIDAGGAAQALPTAAAQTPRD